MIEYSYDVQTFLTKKMLEKIEGLAKEYMLNEKELIEEYIDYCLDFFDAIAVNDLKKRLENGETYKIPAEDVYKELGL